MNQHVFIECNAHFPTTTLMLTLLKVVFEIEMGCHQSLIRQQPCSHLYVLNIEGPWDTLYYLTVTLRYTDFGQKPCIFFWKRNPFST